MGALNQEMVIGALPAASQCSLATSPATALVTGSGSCLKNGLMVASESAEGGRGIRGSRGVAREGERKGNREERRGRERNRGIEREGREREILL